ncbi:DNA polymerase [Kitasatospora sp. MMS16-BH015]|uniref:error-prone DNA polymerase n=1 Tax=Kitasatospora sp. MMS16-BH015 TaxID=2018025 RepID=UPI000CA2E02F|nr:error-prone DNA polymerase [Kitasatospora sp. MMS16-BH015]AUG76399.1 DNA polymerase [Kitasatospora sp. MMS16-BH015]
MGFTNHPSLSWQELNRRLSGAPAAPLPEPETPDPIAPSRSNGPSRPNGPSGPYRQDPAAAWAELHVHSAFSFLDGTSDPEALATEAARLGVETLGLTDHDGLYGVVRLAKAAKELGLSTVAGAELTLGPEEHLLVLARGPEGYRRLSAAISAAQLAGGVKGRPVYEFAELAAAHGGHWAVLTGCRKGRVPAALSTTGGERALHGGKFLHDGQSLLSGQLHPDGQLRPDGRSPLGGRPLPDGRPLPGEPAAPNARAAAGRARAERELRVLAEAFGSENVYVELIDRRLPGDDLRNDRLAALAARVGLTTVASNNVHQAGPAQARLAQGLAALHGRRTLQEAAGWTDAAGAAHLRSGAEMARRLARFPGVQRATVELGRDCAFEFTSLAPALPGFPVSEGESEIGHLRALVVEGGPRRFGAENAAARKQLAVELDVIEQLGLAGYFLIVHDIVEYCRREDIWCQGRGSAANSAVCYALGITAVDPIRYRLLFERFLSVARDGPPDIDLDIEHRRREEVIQYLYRRYGREHAAQVANVITYRPRLALRDAARVLGYPRAQVDAFSRQSDFRAQPTADALIPADVLGLAQELHGLPRHLGIHSGGMVLTERPIGEICPTEWARMPGRSVLQWDKESVAGAELVKIDLLGLGMLSALHDTCDLIAEHHGLRYDLASIPKEAAEVYEMLGRADTVGVFQVESRAQMATLPRLKPTRFYDLVVEVALIRPGPIQGGSVHPYLRRRAGLEPSTCPHPSMENALGKTLGVPLFQEQMMQLAIDCAGFSPAEADRLRQAMGAKRSHQRVAELRERLLAGMAARGIPAETAEDVYGKIEAFSNYGFPESHAISFAYLVYASAWLKHHYPAAFTCALLANQPMGFYSPLSLTADARRHGVRVRGVDVNSSAPAPSLEPDEGAPAPAPMGRSPHPQPAVRLGLTAVRGLGAAAAEAVAAGRPYADLEDFARRTGLATPVLEALATAGAFGCFGLSRRQALWAAGAYAGSAGVLPGTAPGTEAPGLPPMTPVEETIADLWSTGTSATSHPLQHLRASLAHGGALSAAELARTPHGTPVVVGGLVTHRQRPPTAGGVLFLSLEDETGLINVVCNRAVWEPQRRTALDRAGLLVHGHVERREGAVNLVASRLTALRIGV